MEASILPPLDNVGCCTSANETSLEPSWSLAPGKVNDKLDECKTTCFTCTAVVVERCYFDLFVCCGFKLQFGVCNNNEVGNLILSKERAVGLGLSLIHI